MSKLGRLSGALVATAMLAGCTARNFVDDSMTRLEPGQNMVQVSAILGAPAKLHRDGDREAWLYCYDGVAVDRYLIAWFRSYRLVKAEAFPDYDWGQCLEFFDSFSFDRMPEVEYEKADDKADDKAGEQPKS